jgi:hypothetical protein
MSVPNVAHLDPQKGGCCSIFPYFNGELIEIPLTTIQDYSLFNILKDYSIDTWRKQCSIIADRYGLISFNIHPDYIIDEQPRNVYRDLLRFVNDELVAPRNAWIALPGQIAEWWRIRSELQVHRRDNEWQIEGAGSQDAVVAYAFIDAGELHFKLEGQC